MIWPSKFKNDLVTLSWQRWGNQLTVYYFSYILVEKQALWSAGAVKAFKALGAPCWLAAVAFSPAAASLAWKKNINSTQIIHQGFRNSRVFDFLSSFASLCMFLGFQHEVCSTVKPCRTLWEVLIVPSPHFETVLFVLKVKHFSSFNIIHRFILLLQFRVKTFNNEFKACNYNVWARITLFCLKKETI